MRSVLAAFGAVVLGASLAACGGSPSTASSGAAQAGKAMPAAAGEPAPTVTKISANSASQDEIAAALKTAGVTSPQRWAAEVVEYRPYAGNDPGLTKLQHNLAKYNPGQATVDKIVSALRP